jgi:hypothetical protein
MAMAGISVARKFCRKRYIARKLDDTVIRVIANHEL